MDTAVPPLAGYTRDQGESDIKVSYLKHNPITEPDVDLSGEWYRYVRSNEKGTHVLPTLTSLM